MVPDGPRADEPSADEPSAGQPTYPCRTWMLPVTAAVAWVVLVLWLSGVIG
jgi:hypothetical protein